MKTSVIKVRDMLSVLSVLGVEQRIGEVPGVESVTVNYAAGKATIRFDETRLTLADIKSGVRQSAYEDDAAPAEVTGDSHKDHEAADAMPAGGTPPAKAAADAAPPTAPKPGPEDAAATIAMPRDKS